MKSIKYLFLGGCLLTLLTGCGEKSVSCEIAEFPKTTFYCGEEFSNTGISLKVTLPNGKSFITEDIATSKPSTSVPGTQQVKVYYTNDEYDIDTFITYEINVIDWTKEEKALFGETSISSFAGVYYPKMEGMKIVTETDDTDGSIVDYWIEKENSSFNELEEYQELLRNYYVKKRMTDTSGTYDVYFKFYEQPSIPSDFYDVYDDLHDLVCFKYCASYIYLDPTYYEEYELYANEIEDTLVIGFNDDMDLVVRFIANSVYLETAFSCEVNERLELNGLYSGSVITYLNNLLLGYTDEDTGTRYMGAIESIAPLAAEYFILPSYEPDVCAIADYAAMYPWLHGEDDFCFEVEIDSDDEDEYNNFVALLDNNSAFVKTAKEDKVKNNTISVAVYTIENKPYVGNLVIEVTNFIPDGASYYLTEGTSRTLVKTGCYRVYYRYQAPDIFSPAQEELMRIYDDYFGAGYYDESDYDIYEEGTVGGLVKYTKTNDNVNSKEEAVDKFIEKYLIGYTCTQDKTTKTVSGYEVCVVQYTNASFVMDIYSYYSGGKYCVEFSIAINNGGGK